MLKERWAIDLVVEALSVAGVIRVHAGDTAPTDKTMIWLDPANPTTSGNGVVKAWNGAAWTTDAANISRIMSMAAFGAVSTAGTADWNHAENTVPGFAPRLMTGTDANGPGTVVSFHAFTIEYQTKTGLGDVTQLAIPYGSSASTAPIYARGRTGGTWGAWRRFAPAFTKSTGAPSGGVDGDVHFQYAV